MTARRAFGRYVVCDPIASGGMAVVHLGRLLGTAGFSRTVAVKRLLPEYARDPEFVAMMLDEARLVARIRHPNVVGMLDVVAQDDELLLVMEYVHGASLAFLLKQVAADGLRVPPPIVSSVVVGMLHGLHAAHEATSERGSPLGVVHRDVSPQNVLIGEDGVVRVLDFGIAKAASRAQTTRDGAVKGKLAYMSPEQIRRAHVDCRTDVFAASVVLWEALTGRRLFFADDVAVIAVEILRGNVAPPSSIVPDLSPAVDAVVLKGLARAPESRFGSAREMAHALESALPPATPATVSGWLGHVAAATLAERAARIAEIERTVGSEGDAGLDDVPPEVQAEARARAERAERAEASTGQLASPAGSLDTGGAVTEVSLTSSAGIKAATARDATRARVRIAWLAGVPVSLVAAASILALVQRSPPPPERVEVTPTRGAATAQPALETSAASPAVMPVEPEPGGSAAAPSAASGPPRERAHTPLAKKPADECNPPYYWDKAKGIKVFKLQCVR